MVFEVILLSTAFIGSTLSAIYDLKTTEIPDKIPYAMIAVGLLLFGIQSYLTWSYWPIVKSLAVGLSLLGFGFLMYYFGQWGGGDAKVLSAMGFLLPELSETFTKSSLLPFSLSYTVNVFLVGAAYMIIYAFIVALTHRKVFIKFLDDMKASSKVLSIGSVALFITFLSINWFLMNYFQLTFDMEFVLKNSLLPLAATIGLFVIWKFSKAVEKVGFKKRIRVSKLKVGDVLNKSKLWEGITKKDLRKIKRSRRKYIVIKEGVRFAPSFPLALIFTLYFGDGLLLFARVLI